MHKLDKLIEEFNGLVVEEKRLSGSSNKGLARQVQSRRIAVGNRIAKLREKLTATL